MLKKKLIFAIGLGRFLSPFLIFLNPVLTELLVWSFDQPDGYLIHRAGWSWRKYHSFDKLFDYWWYVFIFLYAYFAQLAIFPIIAVLFFIRTFGQVVSLITGNEKYLIFFPNILEIYFIAYLGTLLSLTVSIFFYKNQLFILLLSGLFSLSQEYRIHVKKLYIANLLFGLNINWESRK